MATIDDTTAPATSSTGSAFGAALAQPTIAFIREQIAASLPNQIASSITAQFPDAPAGSDQGASSVQPPAAGTPDAGAAFGTALVQPAIDPIRQQISAELPSQLAASTTAQFPTASGQAGPAVQPSTAAAALRALVPDGELKNFLSALNAQPV